MSNVCSSSREVLETFTCHLNISLLMITCHCRLKMSQLFIVSDFREKIVPRINNAIVEAMNSAPMTSSC